MKRISGTELNQQVGNVLIAMLLSQLAECMGGRFVKIETGRK